MFALKKTFRIVSAALALSAAGTLPTMAAPAVDQTVLVIAVDVGHPNQPFDWGTIGGGPA